MKSRGKTTLTQKKKKTRKSDKRKKGLGKQRVKTAKSEKNRRKIEQDDGKKRK